MALAWTEKMSTFYTLRFILGVAEASFYPGLIYYSTKWFPLKYRPRIVGFFSHRQHGGKYDWCPN